MHQHIHTSLSLMSLTTFALLLSTTAIADSPPSYFEMEIKQQRIPIEGNSQLESHSLGIRYRENLADNVGIDMSMGRLGVDHQGNSNALGYSPAGYHAGLGLSANTAAKQRFQAGIDMNYSYYFSDQTLARDKIEIRWTQAEARLRLAMQLTLRLKAYGCAFVIHLDGKQKLNETITAETQLDNRDSAGQCGGLRWETEDNGVIGIEANGGALGGGRIYFGRHFM